ncbi:universal stress protein [Variovorax sp. PBL-E5]|uniref:universal stress protein n=1 Tax=Variovorax sp. PBL-E5 TaxID=434014 RepID=UPI0013189B79|nr:universal stress protein [Variovorax sp. PBL-E5]VTU22224.1 Stress response protein NhaX [Variovorax sp. PBL-E5]
MKILLAVDGSEYTQRMLSYLGSHRDLFGASHAYTAFYAVLPVPHRAAAFAGPALTRSYYEDDASVVLNPIRTQMETTGIDAEFAYEIGHPADLIAARAEQGRFDLVVMGSHGHGALANLVLGSVATKVLAKCSVPILLVR